MYVYAGIDEAGYGPLFGPLMVGRAVFAVPRLVRGDVANPPPHLWQRLSKAVCRNLAQRKGRIAVNDSKKLMTAAAGIGHLEVGCLAFAALAGHRPQTLDQWLTCLGEQSHGQLDALPWYAPTADRPWNRLPAVVSDGEIAVARSLLASTAKRIGVQVLDIGAAAVLEDRFNRMVAATRSKAATSFTFVASHLRHVWDQFGQHDPLAIVDRQGGRTQYRKPLMDAFPEASLTILDESPECSSYRLTCIENGQRKAMTIRFQVQAEQAHMPVALASMISKYTRELLMARFNAYFQSHLPDLAPTAGYATDAKRFWDDLQPHLPTLGIDGRHIRRMA